jgi:hypothetical protein
MPLFSLEAMRRTEKNTRQDSCPLGHDLNKRFFVYKVSVLITQTTFCRKIAKRDKDPFFRKG